MSSQEAHLSSSNGHMNAVDGLPDTNHATSNENPRSSITSDVSRPLSDSWRAEPLTSRERAKVAQTIRACSERDLATLGDLATTEGGFIEDEIRRQVWPILLGSDTAPEPTNDWKERPQHKDESQVALDVNRAFVYYPRNESDTTLATRREALTTLIVSTLRQHPTLSYFQGYHDIAQVLLLVLGLPSALTALPRLTLLKIRDFLLPTLTGTNSQLSLLIPLLHTSDPDLCNHISGLRPYFALAAVLTMFAHDIDDYTTISRLFDYLLSHPSLQLIYMFAAIVTLRRDELFEIDREEPEMLYAVLSKLPNPLDLEALIRRTEGLREMFPPEKLPGHAWRGISTFSVLKTARTVEETRGQDLGVAEKWLALHAEEIERVEKRKAAVRRLRRTAYVYRRPAGAVALAVLVGVVSVWLGRTGQTGSVGRVLGVVQQRVTQGLAQVLGLRL
ncbi:Rab-GTPase-TBC domain-containing protein 2 [Elsinoe fawcettii]|nr:Rab-GTPase-TBC domain-containing protein 2 [Elsinoe fawcettii]